jgi:hypothetical protein
LISNHQYDINNDGDTHSWLPKVSSSPSSPLEISLKVKVVITNSGCLVDVWDQVLTEVTELFSSNNSEMAILTFTYIYNWHFVANQNCTRLYGHC